MSTSTRLKDRDGARLFPVHNRVARYFPAVRVTTFDLWGAVILFCVLDIALTYYGLQIGFIEANPIARVGLSEFGVWTMVLLKVLALGYGFVVTALLDRVQSVVPMILLVIWGLAVASNAHLILLLG